METTVFKGLNDLASNLELAVAKNTFCAALFTFLMISSLITGQPKLEAGPF